MSRLRQIAATLVFRVTYDIKNTENSKQEMLLIQVLLFN